MYRADNCGQTLSVTEGVSPLFQRYIFPLHSIHFRSFLLDGQPSPRGSTDASSRATTAYHTALAIAAHLRKIETIEIAGKSIQDLLPLFAKGVQPGHPDRTEDDFATLQLYGKTLGVPSESG